MAAFVPTVGTGESPATVRRNGQSLNPARVALQGAFLACLQVPQAKPAIQRHVTTFLNLVQPAAIENPVIVDKGDSPDLNAKVSEAVHLLTGLHVPQAKRFVC